MVPTKIIRRSITSAILSVGRPLGKRGRARYNLRVFTLHPQLQTDCHPLGKLTGGLRFGHENEPRHRSIAMEQQTAAGELPERVAIGLELGMQGEHAGVVPRAPALAKGPPSEEDGGRDGSADIFGRYHGRTGDGNGGQQC